MLRRAFGLLLPVGVLSLGCKRSDEVVEGGVYASARPGGDYSVTKVLVLDESAVHLRFYKETFKVVPTTIDTTKLTVSIGHAPLAREGFLTDKPTLIAVEKVAESELEGYRYYQDAMGAGR